VNILKSGQVYGEGGPVKEFPNGFLLWYNGDVDHPWFEGGLNVFTEFLTQLLLDK